MTQPSLCQECAAGPQGVEGHANLVLHVYAAERPGHHRSVFHCTVCGAEWLRTYAGSGGFSWALNGAPT